MDINQLKGSLSQLQLINEQNNVLPPWGIIKEIVCGLEFVLNLILKYIPDNQEMLKEILSVIDRLLLMACKSIPA